MELTPEELDQARKWYVKTYPLTAATSTRELCDEDIIMLASYAKHREGRVMSREALDAIAMEWARSQWSDREDMQDQRMTEFGHAVRILTYARDHGLSSPQRTERVSVDAIMEVVDEWAASGRTDPDYGIDYPGAFAHLRSRLEKVMAK